MTHGELEACRVFLAAFRQVGESGRIEVWVRPHGSPTVRIVRTQTVTASATIAVVAEAR